MLIRTRDEQDVPACVAILRSVHEHDGYPAVWPSDPGRWVTSAGRDAAAWVAVDSHDAIRGHVAVRTVEYDSQLAILTRYPAERLLSVVRLFVDPTGRERGTGAALLRAVADYDRGSRWLSAPRYRRGTGGSVGICKPCRSMSPENQAGSPRIWS